MQRFASIILVRPDGSLLLQERDEHARLDPELWGLVGGHVEEGEDYETAAYRELEEETAVVADPGSLRFWREFSVWHDVNDAHEPLRVFVSPTNLDRVECHEGRRIVFVDAEVAAGLELTMAAHDIVPAFLASETYRDLVSGRSGDQTGTSSTAPTA